MEHLEDATRAVEVMVLGSTLQWRHGHQGGQVKAILRFLSPLFTRNFQRQNVSVTLFIYTYNVAFTFIYKVSAEDNLVL